MLKGMQAAQITGQPPQEELLGEGGMAVVWRSRDASGRPCALKKLRPELERDEALRLRFAAECEALAAIDHPRVIPVLDRDSEGRWLLMPLMEGNLEELVERDGPLEPERALDVLVQLLDGLEAVHAAGIVHRDVKPSNLLLDDEGLICLSDFGVAQVGGGLTETGTQLGTYAYMAPEQLEDARNVGPTADVYGAAATVLYLLSGKPPWRLARPDASSDLFDPLPEDLAAVLRRATAFTPADRYADAGAFRAALGAAPPPRRTDRIGWVTLGLLALTALAIVLARQDEAPPPTLAPAVAEPAPVLAPAVEPEVEPPVEAPEPAPMEVRAPPDPEPRVAQVSVATAPEADGVFPVGVASLPWAEVTIDGSPVGTTPWTGELASGDHELVLETSDGRLYQATLLVDGPVQTCWDFHEGVRCKR